ncbi:MAG: hypothetical protein BMS9Abin02_0148 [Anaerolineae bacterium]|nr:MAG: hypothetical protein BMS9Abin02_0148 [Anaerolineae bacterium]
MVGSESGVGFRLFLLQESEQQGIGIQWQRNSGTQDNCLKTSVYYALWEGSNKDINTTFCQCFDPKTGFVISSVACSGELGTDLEELPSSE